MSYPVTTIIVPVTLSESRTIVPIQLEDNNELIPMQYTAPIQFIERVDWYDGSYDFTPSEQSQTIEISDKTARANIIIEPIPTNYGRITYNGSTILVE
jgi:hypothetical protein